MHIYVASKSDNWRQVRAVQELLKADGHHITYDWTQDVEQQGPGLKGRITDALRPQANAS